MTEKDVKKSVKAMLDLRKSHTTTTPSDTNLLSKPTRVRTIKQAANIFKTNDSEEISVSLSLTDSPKAMQS